MIRTTALPRPIRVGAASLGALGMIALAGCSAEAVAGTAAPSDAGQTATGSASGDVAYADGTYTADGSYATPESVETVSVTLTLKDDVITDVEVTGSPTKRESEQYQAKFIGGIDDAVVGEDIDKISVSRVAGSSLTSGGFNDAVEKIKSEAAK